MPLAVPPGSAPQGRQRARRSVSLAGSRCAPTLHPTASAASASAAADATAAAAVVCVVELVTRMCTGRVKAAASKPRQSRSNMSLSCCFRFATFASSSCCFRRSPSSRRSMAALASLNAETQ